MRKKQWKAGRWETPGGPVSRVVEVLWAFLGHDDAPERPRRFRIVDEDGVEREVFAPPGHVTRWP
jgi:hypothetical protein